jgi:hypothetical protein
MGRIEGMRAVFLGAVAGSCLASSAGHWERSAINLPSASSQFHLLHDFNGDQRRDVLALSGDRVLIFFQSPSGSFPTDPSFSMAVPGAYPVVTAARLEVTGRSSLLFLGPSGIIRQPVGEQGAVLKAGIEIHSGPLDLTTGSRPLLVQLGVDLDSKGWDDLLLPFQDRLEVLSLDELGQLGLRDAANLPVVTARTASVLPGVDSLGARYFEAARLASEPAVRLLHLEPRGTNFLTASVTASLPRTLLVDWDGSRRLNVVTPESIWSVNSGGRFEVKRVPGSLQIQWAATALQNRVRTVANLADFNGDGRLDTFRIDTVSNRLSPRTELELYLARTDRTFGNRPDAILRTRDISLSAHPALGDMDGDGIPEVCLPHLDFQASSAASHFRTFLRDGLRGDLRFYSFDRQRSRFPEAPVAKVPITVSYEIFGAAQLFRPLYAFHGDFDGDGSPDLIAKNGAGSLAVFRNRGGKRGFETRPYHTFSVDPLRVADLEVLDLNQDGLADVVATVYSAESQRRIILAFFVSRRP